ncbi:MAG: type VI secretion system contractile sheath large subunit [Planctomycetes bacterium]|nr:type VI secretion system contractile sheath large subunit [Planctomycetota bacterium]
MTDNFHFEFGRQREDGRRRSSDETRLEMLVVGDFRGRTERESRPAIGTTDALRIDVDGFEATLSRLRPSLRLRPDGREVLLEFSSIDDFHPDHLYARLPRITALADARARLLDSATFEEAAAALEADLQADDDSAPEDRGRDSRTAHEEDTEDDTSTLKRLFGDLTSRPDASHARRSKDVVDDFLKKLMGTSSHEASHRGQAARRDALLKMVDDEIAVAIRLVLHDPDYQELESTWRSLHRLVTTVDDQAVRIHLVDVTREALHADLRTGGTGLRRQLERSPNTAVVIGAFAYSSNEDDIAALETLAAIAAEARTPFVAAARPDLLGCECFSKTPDPVDWQPATDAASRWRRLRGHPCAAWLGLVTPRILLRLPYGTRTDPIEACAFEEMPHAPVHANYLWGNGAFACAELLARGVDTSAPLDLEDLPAHVWSGNDDAPQLTPCAEFYAGQRAAAHIASQGLMTLMSHRDRNAVRLTDLRSVAEPATHLAGRWS